MSNVRIRYEHREIIVNIRDRVFFFFFRLFFIVFIFNLYLRNCILCIEENRFFIFSSISLTPSPSLIARMLTNCFTPNGNLRHDVPCHWITHTIPFGNVCTMAFFFLFGFYFIVFFFCFFSSSAVRLSANADVVNSYTFLAPNRLVPCVYELRGSRRRRRTHIIILIQAIFFSLGFFFHLFSPTKLWRLRRRLGFNRLSLRHS